MEKKITISIIIPVKNGIATIRQCLDAIYVQTLIDQAEVIVIDSGSTDGTLEVLQQYPVRLYQIPPEDFNHGDTRNYGVSLAKGDFVVMTVQDAVTTDNKWLEKITQPFNDPQIMGICGRQMIPEEIDKNPGAWTQTFSKPVFKKTSF
ncbi:MAG: glycosyltransferase family 2 protein, partial [Marinilabiliaceae bacterium]|nr:glycosyltransferase family 2 protein [Marinilabiliaceae bacterium]MBN2821056.1 glycosyltransferase family 2 protein [Bacteroidales bacterium]